MGGGRLEIDAVTGRLREMKPEGPGFESGRSGLQQCDWNQQDEPRRHDKSFHMHLDTEGIKATRSREFDLRSAGGQRLGAGVVSQLLVRERVRWQCFSRLG